MVKVSVIIPTYNYGRFIKEAIDSVLAQSFVDYEVIVIDDGSTDNTAKIVKMICKENVSYIYQNNKGASSARNRGIAESKGKYLLFLDADDSLNKDQLLFFEKSSAKHPEDILYCPWARYIEEESGHRQIIAMGECEESDLLEAWLCGWYISSCAIFWPKKVINSLGGWDETLLANQDGDLAMRALIEGHKFRFCPGRYARIRAHFSEQISLSNIKSIESLESRLYVIQKIEMLIRETNMINKYRNALGIAYYRLGKFCVTNQPKFSNKCYKHFRRLCGLKRPPGSVLNWLFLLLLGIEKKEKFASKLSLMTKHRFSRKYKRHFDIR